MFIIDCLPFSKGLNKESLSYFSTNPVEPGSLIKINIRNKSTNALVISNRSAKENKSEIKSADFQLKKINSITSKPFLQKDFLDASQETADYFATNLGSILSQLLPSFIIENPNLLGIIKEIKNKKVAPQIKTRKEIFILQSENEERYDHYKSLIREQFAKNQSVFICLSQSESITQAKNKLERGIESYVLTFHSEMDKKSLKENWQKACLAEHPVLIIATSKWLFLPRNDFGMLIIDKENDGGWKSLNRPFIDFRFFIEKLAKQKDIDCLIGDNLLRIQTLYRYKQNELKEFKPLKWRLSNEIQTTLIDLRETTKKEKEFKIVSKELISLITENQKNGSHLFIFASRKGLSAMTICRDCGEQVKCHNCQAPMILYRVQTNDQIGGIFRCHQCGETRDAVEVCQNCQSWKLAAYGAGIDRVAEEIRKEIPEIKLFEIHKDLINTNAKAVKRINDFYATRGSVLLGTEMALNYLNQKVDYTAIASFDSLFAIPDFKIREKIFRLIMQTKGLTKKGFLIQTRNTMDPTIKMALNGELQDFYKIETEDRKMLDYPPFGLFIKITVRGNKNIVTRETEKLSLELKNIKTEATEEELAIPKYKPTIFYSTQEKKGEQNAINTVIKIPHSDWPDPILLSVLKKLPSCFEIKIDPENLL